MRRSLYALTKYPKIFRSYYWGSFIAEKNEDIIRAGVIENRNKFVEDYDIVAATSDSIVGQLFQPFYEFDHQEMYRTKEGGIIIIISLYGPISTSALILGFVEYKHLYSDNTNTFVLVFKHRTELRKTMLDYKRWNP